MTPVKTNREALLVVCPEDYDRHFFEGLAAHFLPFSFTESCPKDGFSVRRSDSTGDIVQVDVGSSCQALSGGFSQQALNRVFSQALFRHRPYAVVVVGYCGCTVDLPRVARLLGIPTLLLLAEPGEALESLSEATQCWIESSIAACHYISPVQSGVLQAWQPLLQLNSSVIELSEVKASLKQIKRDASRGLSFQFTYNTYEFCQRDHPLLVKMQRGDTTHFTGCESVLDLGCGVGIFLDCLRQQGVKAVGVERDCSIAEYGRGMGLDIVTGDTLNYLEQGNGKVGGIYCSHFVEHLPFELVQKLLGLISLNVKANGIVVMVFPDPESIRSQLLGFWRDPEHVRFYHPELIISLAAVVGLELEWSSYEAQPHKIVPFEESPPPIEAMEPLPPLAATEPSMSCNTWVDKVLDKLGLLSKHRLEHFEQSVIEWSLCVQAQYERQNLLSQQLQKRTEALWDVNKTWAWNDNVTLKFRKTA